VTDQFVALDVEATAMDPGRGEIVEIALVVFDEHGERDRYSSLVGRGLACRSTSRG
jgi:DNA polymerase III epsilon subunit-like protein